MTDSVSTPGAATPRPDLSIVLPALNEAENLVLLLPALQGVLMDAKVRHEILIVTQAVDPGTADAARLVDARPVVQQERGYGGALLAGFAAARGEYVLTMDADLSHPAEFVRALWDSRHKADVLIASRYVKGGGADMPASRYVLSRILNQVFSVGLNIPIRDMSSGFRLFRAPIVQNRPYVARDFDIVQEILVRAYAGGARLAEIPFHYEPRRHGSSHARVLEFGLAYLRTLCSMCALRYLGGRVEASAR